MPSHTASGSRLHRASNWVFIAFFMTMIWLPLLDSGFQLDPTPPSNEKRAPAPFPELKPGAEGARAFFSGLGDYYADHFGFRNWLVRRQSRWKRQWFGETGTPDVMIGRDGWYYYTGNKMISHFTGHANFDHQTLEAWRDLLEARRDWLAERGIAYLFVVPPDKHSVYPEYLPDWLRDKREPGKLSQLVDFMQANSTVPILDLRPALTKAKQDARLYWLTDTHWNAEGGFVAYQELVRTLAEQLSGLEPLDTTQFTRSYAIQPGGDLATILGQQDLVEPKLVALNPVPGLKIVSISTGPSVYPKTGRKNTEPVVSTNADAVGTAIVFRDSFAQAWMPFLGHHFKRVIYIWEYHWNPDLIERERPQVVIDEMLERYMNEEDPVKLKAEDGLGMLPEP